MKTYIMKLYTALINTVEPPGCERPLKMQRLSGRLQESNRREPFPRSGPGHIYFMEDNLLHIMSKLRHV